MDVNSVNAVTGAILPVQSYGDTLEVLVQDGNFTDGQKTNISISENSSKKNQNLDYAKKMKQVNKVLEDLNKGIHYQLVEKNGRQVIQLVEKEENKVIYQSPPEGILEAASKIHDAVGLVIDHRK